MFESTGAQYRQEWAARVLVPGACVHFTEQY